MEPDGILERLLIPDILLPSQFSQRPTNSPLRRLYLAVLEDALRLVVRGRTRPTDETTEAKRWLASDADGAFSATSICDELGIPLHALRTASLTLVRWRRRPPPYKPHQLVPRYRRGSHAGGVRSHV